jgi:hypothetical protein
MDGISILEDLKDSGLEYDEVCRLIKVANKLNTCIVSI